MENIICELCGGSHGNNSNCQRSDINKYVRNCIIDEYANKDYKNGYSLDVNDIPAHEIDNFLAELMKYDSGTKDYVLNEMQKLIDKNIGAYEEADMIIEGLYRYNHPETGEICIDWRR